MNKKFRDTLNNAYAEQEPLEAKADTLNDLHQAMQRKHKQSTSVLIHMLRYRMPAYQTLALASVLLAVIAWMYVDNQRSTTNDSIVNAPTLNNTYGAKDATGDQAGDQATIDTDAIVRRVVDSVRSEMQREAAITRRSLEGVTKKSMERVAQRFNDGGRKPLHSPMQNDVAGGLENLTQLQYQQRGKSLADDGVVGRFNDTVMSETLR